jgi:hypothetical protein
MLQCTYDSAPIKENPPMKTFEDAQVFGKDGFEAAVASATAFAKNYQTIAQEAADYARRSFELGTGAFEKVSAARSIERVLEVQQGYAKEAYEAFVAQSARMGELYAAAAKDVVRPYENSFAKFGFTTAK